MLEHEQNMIALNDHLQMTRLRQQKRFVNLLVWYPHKIIPVNGFHSMSNCIKKFLNSTAGNGLTTALPKTGLHGDLSWGRYLNCHQRFFHLLDGALRDDNSCKSTSMSLFVFRAA